MEFRILGPIEALDGQRLVPLGGPNPRAVVGVLLLSANRVVPLHEIVQAIWRDPPPTAETAVRVYVSRLRKELPPGRLETRAPGYVLRVEDGELDLERFERLAEQGRRELARRDATAAETLRRALALWRGEPLAGAELGGSARAEVHRLEELRSVTLEDRIDADLAAGRDAELIGELEALVARDPLRERLRGQLMLALYRAGRQTEALEAYRALRQALDRELGIEPGTALRRLHTSILQQAPELEGAAPAAERARACVLFAVLVPSPAAGTDPEVVRELLEEALEAATTELRAAGAVVERGLAGALLARFAADARQALHAAEALRERISEHTSGLVGVRIGIELGDVLAGKGGLSGTPVAVAARLAGSAKAGEILVGEEAARTPR